MPRIAKALLGGALVASSVLAGCASPAIEVSVDGDVAGGVVPASEGPSGSTEDADRFAPVDAEAAPTPAATPVPTPTATAVPTPTATREALPLPPAPAFFPPVENECPGVRFETPVLFVWNIAPDGPALAVHAAADPASAELSTFDANSLAGLMTGGCRLGADETPWFEFMLEDNAIGYADSRFLRQGRLACLDGTATGRMNPDIPPDVEWSGPLDGHAFDDGGPYIAFLPNASMGSSDSTYRLVERAAITFASPVEPPPCLAPGPPGIAPSFVPVVLSGECSSGPTTGPDGASIDSDVLLVELNGRPPSEALIEVTEHGVVQGPTTVPGMRSWRVHSGAAVAGRCDWLPLADIHRGNATAPDGTRFERDWVCIDGDPAQLQTVELYPETDSMIVTDYRFFEHGMEPLALQSGPLVRPGPSTCGRG